MPNHCSNTLIVRGHKSNIKQFKKENIKGGELTFAGICPVPEELLEHPSPCIDEKLAKEMTEKYGSPNWYEWALTNWGTKWDAYDQSDLIEDEDSLTIHFTTAWGPAEAWFNQIAERYPTLAISMQYEECGMMFSGKFSALAGNITHVDIPPKVCEKCETEYYGEDCWGCDES